MRSREADSQGMHLYPSARMLAKAEMHPFQLLGPRVDFLRHLGPKVEEFYVNGRDIILSSYPQQRIHFWVVWGRTGVGKKIARAQLEYAVAHDPVLQKGLAERDATLRVVDLPFSHAVNIARLTGEMDPKTPRGLFLPEEYQRGSKILTRYTFGELDNFHLLDSDNPKETILAIVEPSGPTADIDELIQALKGWDRGFSTVHLLAERCKDITRVLVIARGHGLLEKIIADRQILEPLVSPQQVIEFVLKAPLEVVKEGKPADIRKWSPEDLMDLGQELVASHASSEGVIASNQQTDWLMQEVYHTRNEQEFWPALLDRLRFAPADCLVASNKPSGKGFHLLQSEVDINNPMIEEIKMRQAILRSR